MTRRHGCRGARARVRQGAGREGRAHLRTVAAAVVETVQAPPAVVFLHALQCQIPTAVRLTESLPQKVHLHAARRWSATLLGLVDPPRACVRDDGTHV
jgi:hypothetical protein